MSTNNTDTHNTGLLSNEEILSIYGTSSPSGNKQVNAVKAPALYGGKLTVIGDVFVYGSVRTPLQLSSGVYFGDGTEEVPSITFANEPNTGLYRAGAGLIGVSSQGVTDVIIGGGAMQVDAEITTSSGSNLVINPSGSSIDFSGKTLINIGGISTNPNRYEVIAPTVVITSDAVPTTILTISTVSGSAYTITVDVAVANTSDSTSTAGITLSAKAKNIGGVTGVTTATYAPIVDVGLNTIEVEFSTSGTDVIIVATGIAATTIKWQAAANITRQLF